MNLVALILLPSIAALLGWLGVRLALHLIFRPVQPRRILGMDVQGLFPKNKARLAASLGEKAGEMIETGNLAEKAKDPALVASLMPGIERHIDAFLQQRLKEKIPVLAMFLSDGVLNTIRVNLLEEIEALLPQVIGQFADGLGSTMDVRQLVTQKLAAIPPDRFEDMIRNSLGREIRLLERAGAILGLTIGIIQLLLSAALQAI